MKIQKWIQVYTFFIENVENYMKTYENSSMDTTISKTEHSVHTSPIL